MKKHLDQIEERYHAWLVDGVDDVDTQASAVRETAVVESKTHHDYLEFVGECSQGCRP